MLIRTHSTLLNQIPDFEEFYVVYRKDDTAKEAVVVSDSSPTALGRCNTKGRALTLDITVQSRYTNSYPSGASPRRDSGRLFTGAICREGYSGSSLERRLMAIAPSALPCF